MKTGTSLNKYIFDSYPAAKVLEALMTSMRQKEAEEIAMKTDNQWEYDEFIEVLRADKEVAIKLSDYLWHHIITNTHNWGLGLLCITKQNDYRV